MSIRLKKKTFQAVEVSSPKAVETPAYQLRERIQKKYKIFMPKNPCRDGEEPEMPRDITTLTDAQLSQRYGEMSAFAGYVHTVAANYDVEYILLENDSKVEDAIQRLKLVEDGNIPKHVKEDLAFVSEEARTKRAAKLERKAMFKILGAKLEGIERNIRALSREQTRREKDHERRPGHQT